jgi:hypothetical protein
VAKAYRRVQQTENAETPSIQRNWKECELEVHRQTLMSSAWNEFENHANSLGVALAGMFNCHYTNVLTTSI